MGFGAIMIDKIHIDSQDHNLGYYEVSTNHFDVENFYICIDRSRKTIKFFQNKNFTEDPIRIVDYNNKNEKLGVLPGVPTKILAIVLLQAFKTFKMDTFPEHLHYMA